MAIVETISGDPPYRDRLERRTYAWTSNASGAATLAISDLNGTIERAWQAPGAGTLAPSASYSVTLLDENGYDVFGGGLGTCTATATHQVLATGTAPVLPIATYGTVTLTVAGAGDSNTGTTAIMFRR